MLALGGGRVKPSRYNVVVDRGDELLVYNTLYDSMATCCGEEALRVKHALTDGRGKSCSCRETDDLHQLQFLVDDGRDEIATVEQRKRAGVLDANRLDLIIMPTLACNFGCVYCYEERSPAVMGAEVVKAVKQWMSHQVPQHKLVMLHWFGGEPLIAFPTLVTLTKHAQEVAKRSGCEVITHITSNGFLLDSLKIETLNKLLVTSYQITIDGPPAVHDRLRPQKNGRGSFGRCFANIIELSSSNRRVHITLRINFNHTNIGAIPELLEMFPQGTRPQLRVVYEPIFGGAEVSAADNLSAEELAEQVEVLYALAGRLGYDASLGRSIVSSGKLVYCYAERESQYIINYNGDVFKCSVGKFRREERVGWVSEYGEIIKDRDQWERWVGEPLFESECYKCVYLPLCMGGCRKARLQGQRRGSLCPLVATNASYALKQVAWGGLKKCLKSANTSGSECLDEG